VGTTLDHRTTSRPSDRSGKHLRELLAVHGVIGRLPRGVLADGRPSRAEVVVTRGEIDAETKAMLFTRGERSASTSPRRLSKACGRYCSA